MATVLLAACAVSGFAQHSDSTSHPTHRKHAHVASKKHRKLSPTHSARKNARAKRRHQLRRLTARQLARVHQLHHAFVSSSELRPMAQQLIAMRTPQAYAGVLHYAHTHSGEAAAAAYLALGQAYLQDQKFPQAAASFQQASRAGQALDDYADYLSAKANDAQQQYDAARRSLRDFAGRHPDSVLIDQAALLLAQIDLSQGDLQSALAQLTKLDSSPLANSSAYLFLLGRAKLLAGDRNQAQRIFTQIYVDYPISAEAAEVPGQFQQMGIAAPFTLAQSIRHADGLYLAGHYGAAAAEYRTLANDSAAAGTEEANNLLARAAVALLKQTHHVDSSLLARLSDSNDEAGATRLYLLMESARDRKDTDQVKAQIDQLEQRFPASRWTAEALYSAGNMALVSNDMPAAVHYYGDLASRFPKSSMAPMSHWHQAWLTYRLGDKKAAAQLFDEQIARYPNDSHLSAALYWRGVVYQEVENNPTAAAAYYKKLADIFSHYYYGGLAQQRLAALGAATPAALPQLAQIDDPPAPELTDQIPADEIHVERARLLANAGLNQYIVSEIAASPDSADWRAYAEAQIYSSYGETWRAMRILKQKVHSYFALPLDALPRGYWDLLFPQPYWPTLRADSERQGLNPFLVASLIRQETEFNPGAISNRDAMGLMQLLPSVGKELAHKNGVRPYRTSYLLNPDVNLTLGTIYFRQLMDEFHGQPEYALAAYNAGDDRVKTWLANGPYASLAEFVESIPFTQTREYVQAILRNQEIYRQLYGAK